MSTSPRYLMTTGLADTTTQQPCYQMKVAGDSAEVMIDDLIGQPGISAKRFCDDLKALRVAKIAIHINSGGGDFFDACAMYVAIKEHPAEITCHVDGLAASAASLIAIAGDKCVISNAGFLMIHNVSAICRGSAAELRKQAEIAEKLSNQSAEMYAQKTGKSAAAMSKLMDAETWFTAAEAVEIGLADAVKDAADEGDDGREHLVAQLPRILQQYKNTPARLQQLAAQAQHQPTNQIAAPVPVIRSEQKPIRVSLRDGQHFIEIGDKEVPLPAPAAKDGKLYLDATFEREVTVTMVASNHRNIPMRIFQSFVRGGKNLVRLDSGEEVVVAEPNDPGSVALRAKQHELLAAYVDGMDTAGTAQRAGERWDSSQKLRQLWACATSEPTNPEYQRLRARYIAGEVKHFNDNAGKKTEGEPARIGPDTSCDCLCKNCKDGRCSDCTCATDGGGVAGQPCTVCAGAGSTCDGCRSKGQAPYESQASLEARFNERMANGAARYTLFKVYGVQDPNYAAALQRFINLERNQVKR